MRPSCEGNSSPSIVRGRRECRMRAAPAVSCAMGRRRAHMSIQGSGENPTSPAQGLYGLSRDLLGVLLFCLRGAPKAIAQGCIDASTAASGPHVFAVRVCRARQSQLSRPPHPRPTFVTIASAPLVGTGWRWILPGFHFWKSEIFFYLGFDTISGNRNL